MTNAQGSNTQGPKIEVHNSAATLPEAGPAFAAAATQGLSLRVLTIPTDEASKRDLTKRRHDLKGAMRTLGYGVQAMQSGYRFDDDKGEMKIEAIAKAVRIMQGEAELLMRMLEDPPSPLGEGDKTC